MNHLVLIVNTLTNGFALFPMIRFAQQGNYIGVFFTSCAILASSLMHLTETKHGLVPFWGKEYSALFLNLDRIFAGVLFGHGLVLSLPLWGIRMKPIVATFLFGVFHSALGERTSNLSLYLLHHTLWHACAFSALYQILE